MGPKEREWQIDKNTYIYKVKIKIDLHATKQVQLPILTTKPYLLLQQKKDLKCCYLKKQSLFEFDLSRRKCDPYILGQHPILLFFKKERSGTRLLISRFQIVDFKK